MREAHIASDYSLIINHYLEATPYILSVDYREIYRPPGINVSGTTVEPIFKTSFLQMKPSFIKIKPSFLQMKA